MSLLKKSKKILKYSFFIIIAILIPIASVFLSRLFKVAQGEKNEEIVAGLMLGLVLDLVYSTYLCFMEKKADTDKKNKVLISAIFFCIAAIIIALYILY